MSWGVGLQGVNIVTCKWRVSLSWPYPPACFSFADELDSMSLIYWRGRFCFRCGFYVKEILNAWIIRYSLDAYLRIETAW